MKKKIDIGELLLQQEKIIDQLIEQGCQWGDILYLIYGHLVIHEPQAQEEYLDGTHPVFYYGADLK